MTATADITVKKVENALLIPSAALRFTPPVQEEKKKDEEKKSSGSLVGSLFPRPSRQGSQKSNGSTGNKSQQRVWTLKDGQLSAVPVTIGSTDGAMTEVVAGDIQPGMAVVVDILSAVK
jgi:HlyD family secretion protein